MEESPLAHFDKRQRQILNIQSLGLKEFRLIERQWFHSISDGSALTVVQASPSSYDENAVTYKHCCLGQFAYKNTKLNGEALLGCGTPAALVEKVVLAVGGQVPEALLPLLELDHQPMRGEVWSNNWLGNEMMALNDATTYNECIRKVSGSIRGITPDELKRNEFRERVVEHLARFKDERYNRVAQEWDTKCREVDGDLDYEGHWKGSGAITPIEKAEILAHYFGYMGYALIFEPAPYGNAVFFPEVYVHYKQEKPITPADVGLPF